MARASRARGQGPGRPGRHFGSDEYLDIIRFIAQANPDAAGRVADTIDRIVTNLGDMATGRAGRVTGTYEKVVPGLPYIVAYELTDRPGGSQVAVLHVIHGARDWPDTTA